MKPLEAVARGLARLRCFTGEEDAVWPDFVEDARAAITALRDAGVTEGMIVACTEVWSDFQDNETGEQVAAEFRAMLDAVLEE